MSRSYVALVVVGVSLLVAELVLRRHRKMAVNLRETGVSLAVGTMAYSTAGVSQLAVGALAFWFFSNFALWQFSVANPLTWIGFVLLDDFFSYWVHRAEHRFRVLWSAHSVHHSPTDFSMVNAARLSPIEALYQPLSTLWAPLLGFPIEVYAPLAVVSLIYFQLQHTQVIGRLRWLDPWLSTPSNHRVHHGSNRRYLDRNFGGWTMIWDRLFGTYQRESEPVVFGITDPPVSDGVLATALGGFPRLLRDMADAPTARDAVHVALGRPVSTVHAAERVVQLTGS